MSYRAHVNYTYLSVTFGKKRVKEGEEGFENIRILVQIKRHQDICIETVVEPSLCMKPMSMDSGTPSIKIPSQIENATEESGASPPSAAPSELSEVDARS